jgi:hypothetical protein
MHILGADHFLSPITEAMNASETRRTQQVPVLPPEEVSMTFWIKPTAETVMRSLHLRKDEGGARLSAMALAAGLVVLVFVGTEIAWAPGATTHSTTIALTPD